MVINNNMWDTQQIMKEISITHQLNLKANLQQQKTEKLVENILMSTCVPNPDTCLVSTFNTMEGESRLAFPKQFPRAMCTYMTMLMG